MDKGMSCMKKTRECSFRLVLIIDNVSCTYNLAHCSELLMVMVAVGRMVVMAVGSMVVVVGWVRKRGIRQIISATDAVIIARYAPGYEGNQTLWGFQLIDSMHCRFSDSVSAQ